MSVKQLRGLIWPLALPRGARLPPGSVIEHATVPSGAGRARGGVEALLTPPSPSLSPSSASSIAAPSVLLRDALGSSAPSHALVVDCRGATTLAELDTLQQVSFESERERSNRRVAFLFATALKRVSLRQRPSSEADIDPTISPRSPPKRASLSSRRGRSERNLL